MANYPFFKFLWEKWLDELVQKQEEKREIYKVNRFNSQRISRLQNKRKTNSITKTKKEVFNGEIIR